MPLAPSCSPVGKAGLGPTEESLPHLGATEMLEIELNETVSLSWQSACILISRWSIASNALRRAQGPSLLAKGVQL